MIATYKKHILEFKQASGTSRGILKTKETWFIILEENGNKGIGECGILRGLSIDDRPDYEDQLKYTCDNINKGLGILYQENEAFPSIQIGLEIAFKSLVSKDEFDIFPSDFSKGNSSIPINGLIWMGTEVFMKQQIKDKIEAGFSCIKMKIGAIDFDTELNLLKSIRKEFNQEDIELRVDANGAFAPNTALEKLKQLSEFNLHSIEQPIKKGQIQEMARLCEKTPLPIALDEELIGVFGVTKQRDLLQTIKPQYIILKPSFIGGFKGSNQWIDLAKEQKIGWWITSALESNIGLNAITQYTFTKQVNIPQGLGTGSLYTNNISSPLEIKKGHITYNTKVNWDFKF
ncbi:o-succinylbenzoate synthase [Aurantibacter sp.]|uniref:o-succinylbenzoate synthase n=1 Tax=Aurantibacter sp. TaxID=2807103 RepID=UPI0035C82FE2